MRLRTGCIFVLFFFVVDVVFFRLQMDASITDSLRNKLLQNFQKVAPKFFKSCLKLLDFSKRLLNSTAICCLFS